MSSARLIRQYHEAVAGFPVPDNLEPMVGAPSEGPLVCHNDLAPGNTIYDHERAVALIDFDLAGPGDAVWDLASAAWRYVPLYEGAFFTTRGVPMPDQARRLALMLDAYGLADRHGFLDVVCARMLSLGSQPFVMPRPTHNRGPRRSLPDWKTREDLVQVSVRGFHRRTASWGRGAPKRSSCVRHPHRIRGTMCGWRRVW